MAASEKAEVPFLAKYRNKLGMYYEVQSGSKNCFRPTFGAGLACLEGVSFVQVLRDEDDVVEDWETEWVNDETGASQEVEWFVEDWADNKESSSKV